MGCGARGALARNGGAELWRSGRHRATRPCGSTQGRFYDGAHRPSSFSVIRIRIVGRQCVHTLANHNNLGAGEALPREGVGVPLGGNPDLVHHLEHCSPATEARCKPVARLRRVVIPRRANV